MQAVLDDLETADIDEKTRVMLRFLEKMTLHPDTLSVEDGKALREADISEEAAEDAILVSFMFNLMDRLADSFEYFNPETEAHDRASKYLLRRGYKM
ncbi:MAG: hypothetical protein AAFP70_18595 [Calditrichota bacterium]